MKTKYNQLSSLGLLFALICGMCSFSASALPPSYYAQSSRLSVPGHWVKVKVTESGIQAIDHATLQEWGFADPSKVRVYGFSGIDIADNVFNEDQPDDLPEVYSENIDGRLFFYGEGDVRINMTRTLDFTYKRNYYSTYSCYFLSDADIEPLETEKVPFAANESVITTHYSSILYEPEQENPAEAGVYYFSKRLNANPEVGQKTFNLKDYAYDESGMGQKVVLSYACVAKYEQPQGGALAMSITPTLSSNVNISSKSIKSIQSVSVNNSSLQFYSPLPANSTIGFNLTEGNSFDVAFTDPGINGCSYLALDFACANYTRDNRLGDNGQVLMTYPTALSTNVRVREADADTRVWDITEPKAVRTISINVPNAGDDLIEFSAGRSTAVNFAVFNPKADNLCSPEYVETVQSADLHADQNLYDMVIITTRDLLAQANSLADIHRNLQNMDVKVVLHDDIYNEFSSGAPSAIAYRRYLKMLHDRNPGILRYALLFGHGSYDNRHLVIADQNYLQTYQIAEDRFSTTKRFYRWSPQAYTSDNYFGMLDDSFDPEKLHLSQVDIAVSRIPVAGASDGKTAINKILNYLADVNSGFFQSRALLIADDGDENAHLEMAEAAAKIIADNRPATMITKVYNGLYPSNQGIPKQHVQQALAQGVGYMGYSGHGDPNYIGMPVVFYRTDVRNYSFGNNPIVFLATCHGVVMDQTSSSVGMEMIKSERGPVFIGGSGRLVYLESNPFIYNGFTTALFSAAADDLTGDIWRNGFNIAQVNTKGNEDDCINNLNYLTVGDPALPVGTPSLNMTVTAINSNPVGEETIKISAMEPILIEGKIVDKDGNVMTGFNGSATLTLLDGQTVKETHGQNDGGIKSKVEMDETLLAMTGTKVVDGSFSATIVAPMGAVINSINRLVMTATNKDETQRAIGTYNGLTIIDSTSTHEDVDGPEITALYLDDPSFVNGDAVGPSPTLYATIAPDASGVAIANGILGARPHLTLDDKTSLKDAASSIRFDSDGTATLKANIFNLADGYHNILLDVCDNLGNHSTRRIDFIVVNNALTATLSCDKEVVRDEATITLNAPPSAQSVHLVIEDAAGNTVESIENPTFPYVWKPGASVKDGLYRIFTTLKTETRFAKTPMLELMLIK